MRIISGRLKGKKITFLKSSITRPLKDFVKENIFNIISHSKLLRVNLENALILDLYSGIGSFGIECLSRGAGKVIFVENEKNASMTLKKNIVNFSLQEKSVIVFDKISNFLDKEKHEKFDIIFLDPPFAEENYLEELKIIKRKKFFNKNYIIIIHRENNKKEDYKGIIKPILIKKYRRSKIIFARF